MRASAATRIYWLTEEFYPPQVGGLELMVSRLSHALLECGFDVEVITRQPDTPCAPRERLGDLVVRRIRPGGRFKGEGWSAIPVVVAYLARLALLLLRDAFRYDVLIVSGMKIIPLVAVPVSRLLRKRCIVRLESTSEIAEPVTSESATGLGKGLGRLVTGLLGRLQRWVLSRADCIVAPSRQLVTALLERGIPSAIVREIPNAIDLRRFHAVSAGRRTRLRAHLGLPRDATLVVFAARLSRAKGIELLVEAWPEIVSRHPDLCLVIVGAGGESFDNCEAEVRESIRRSGLGTDRIQVVGMREDVHRFLQAADLYILPSHYEGFGVGLIEALASELPVLVTPVGVAPQLIRDGENGFLFPIDARAAMISTIDAALAARDEWPAIGVRARAAVVSMDLGGVARQYAVLIDALLATTAAARAKSQLG